MTTDCICDVKLNYVSPTRQRVMGVVFLVFGVWHLVSCSAVGSSRDAVTNVRADTAGGVKDRSPDLVLPDPAHPECAGGSIAACLGVMPARARGALARAPTWCWGWWPAFLSLAFLVWAAAGKSLNLAGLLDHHALQGGAAHPGGAVRLAVRARRGGQHRHRGHDADGRHGGGAGWAASPEPVGRLAGCRAGRRADGAGPRRACPSSTRSTRSSPAR